MPGVISLIITMIKNIMKMQLIKDKTTTAKKPKMLNVLYYFPESTLVLPVTTVI